MRSITSSYLFFCFYENNRIPFLQPNRIHFEKIEIADEALRYRASAREPGGRPTEAGKVQGLGTLDAICE